MRSFGEGQQRGEGGAGERGHRADLHEARLAHDAGAAARVTRQAAWERARCAGWASCEVEALGEEQEAVEEAAREDDVVVDHEQPVVLLGRVGREQAVEVLELPEPFGRARVQLDVVAGAHQLGTDRRGQRTPARGARRRARARAGAEGSAGAARARRRRRPPTSSRASIELVLDPAPQPRRDPRRCRSPRRGSPPRSRRAGGRPPFVGAYALLRAGRGCARPS